MQITDVADGSYTCDLTDALISSVLNTDSKYASKATSETCYVWPELTAVLRV